MPRMKSSSYAVPTDLVMGTRLNGRVPESDQRRQRQEIEAVLNRLRTQPGVIVADEVGMGKTYVALGVAYSVAMRSPLGPVIVMVPANLVDKWEQDLKAFCELYVAERTPLRLGAEAHREPRPSNTFRYGVARDSVSLMKLLDDPTRRRAHLIFLTQSAMARQQTDRWVRLALIAEALRRHGRGKASRLIKVKKQIHRFMGELLWALGTQRRHEFGEELWENLLKSDPGSWKDVHNRGAREGHELHDDPVPKSVTRALAKVDLKPLATALEGMPVRARRKSTRVQEARRALAEVERDLWTTLLVQARWRSPLLVMDEAHHLKNVETALARQLQSVDSQAVMRTGDGAMSRAFDRMLFLTATPFQLGHHELVRVLERFGDVRWDKGELGDRAHFEQQLSELRRRLDDSQRAAIALQRAWSRLRPDDCDGGPEAWWTRVAEAPRDSLTHRERAVVEAYDTARRTRQAAQEALRPWVVRHNKGILWQRTEVPRRARLNGAAIADQEGSVGLPIASDQIVPFFLAARSAVNPGSDVLGEALSSSYEAFRFTRAQRKLDRDNLDLEPENVLSSSTADLASWYLGEFDSALEHARGGTHPKVAATVRRVVDLWEAGEKVLVFAFYRRTCRALRIHISDEIRHRLDAGLRRRLAASGSKTPTRDPHRLLKSVQERFFGSARSRGRRALDHALTETMEANKPALDAAKVTEKERGAVMGVMRRFLRASTTLARCFPLDQLDTVDPEVAVAAMLDHADSSGTSWREKFHTFVDFLANRCSSDERALYLEASGATKTGGIRVEDDEEGDGERQIVAVPNVQVAMGTTKRDTRQSLMRAFNTPFFPDILVCSEVMGEGVDLHRFCRHVIHHDLAWNPSTIEQRTGRIDRLGCKAEGRQPIVVYVPYLAGTADERQYQVMSHREQWFRVVMGQDEVAKLITADSENAVPLPASVAEELSFRLGLESKERTGFGRT
jgi:superfamily II DNA or RNA helicase